MFKLKVLSQVIAAAAAASLLVGCSSGSSSGSASTDTTEVSGSVFASYVAGAEVVVTDGINKIAGPVKTNAMGGFKVSIANAQLANKLFFEATGGTYTDEATGTKAVNSGRLAVFAAAGSLEGNKVINATPASTIIEQLIAKHGLSKTDAEAAFKTAFGYLPDTSVVPVDVTGEDSAASKEANKLAGVRAAAFSQLLKDLGLAPGDHKALLDALAEDLAVGGADGQGASGAVQLKDANLNADIASKFTQAFLRFIAEKDKSDTSLGQVGMIPFHAEAISGKYKFKLPEMTKFSQGKTTFDLTVTDLEDGALAELEGTSPMMHPMMHMSEMMHSTPHMGCENFNAEGVSACTVYFLMPTMMNGAFAGNWDLKFEVGGESVNFFPKVDMKMGVRAKLKGVDDMVSPMMAAPLEARTYNLFNNGLSGEGDNRDVEIFISALESMKSFPALVNNEVLNAGTTYELTTNNIVVKVSTDNSIWVEASTSGNGLWTALGLTGLEDGVKSTLYVKLSVAGEPKVINGAETAEFPVTPGGSSSMPMTGSM